MRERVVEVLLLVVEARKRRICLCGESREGW
jgi:hypothetical protein